MGDSVAPHFPITNFNRQIFYAQITIYIQFHTSLLKPVGPVQMKRNQPTCYKMTIKGFMWTGLIFVQNTIETLQSAINYLYLHFPYA